MRRFEVAPEVGVQRLDRFLATQLGTSRRRVRELIVEGAIALDARPVGLAEKGTTLVAGSVLEVVEAQVRAGDHIVPQAALPLTILERGDGWLAIDKPAGVAVHPLRGGETGSVLNAVAARWPEVQGVGEGGLRSGVVHRLDVDTSGVLLVATRRDCWERLRRAFRKHEVEKRYRALVFGVPHADLEVSLEFGLRVGRHRPARVTVCDLPLADAQPRGVWRVSQALRVLEPFHDASLVEVRPLTGFLHQIRATLAHLGHPLLGDNVYGSPTAATRAPRHMLHAAWAESGSVSAASPDPPDFAAALASLRNGAPSGSR